MTFISRVEYSDISYPFTLAEHNLYGDLYLRCDIGNPGACFEDIEIIARRETDYYGMDGRMLIGEANNYVLDNLSFKYFIKISSNNQCLINTLVRMFVFIKNSF